MQFNLKGTLGAILATCIFSTPAFASTTLDDMESIGNKLTSLTQDELTGPVDARRSFAASVQAEFESVLSKTNGSELDTLSAQEQERFDYLSRVIPKRLAVLACRVPSKFRSGDCA